MKIGLISREYPPETGWGGIGTYTYELAHGLTHLGHEVHVVAFAPQKDSECFDDQVYVHRIASPSIRGLWRLDQYLPVFQILYSIRVAKKINELITKYQIEFIEAPEIGFESLFFSLRKKIPLVIKFHTPHFLLNELIDAPPRIKDKVIAWIEQWGCRQADFYSAPSLRMAKLIALRYKLDLDKIKIIPLPIDINEFSPAVQSHQDDLTVLFSGRLEMRKGIHILVEAIPKVLAQVPRAKFILAGRDVYHPKGNQMMSQWLKEKIGPCPQLTFAGHLTRDKLIEQYRRSSICVMPSLWENFGYAGLEAMACGKPLIISNETGLGEAVDVDSVVSIAVKNPEALASAIIDLLKNPEKRQALGIRARRQVEKKFSQVVISEKIAQYYRQILNSRNGELN